MASLGAPVVISPFANERVRQWPAAHFRELVELIWREHGLQTVIVGTRAQRASGNIIVRGLSSEIVANACGAMSWRELVAAVDAAPYVVANNSGVAHLAAARGRWTLCVFAASHAPVEWMPRGPSAVTIVLRLPCAPCSIGGDLCPNGVACMTDLRPKDVFWRFDEARRKAMGDQPVERCEHMLGAAQ
jgi:ADP-heptose:LPS heptosyltransferase